MTTPESAGFDWDRDFRKHALPITIRVLAVEHVKLEHAALEEMVERMLTTPESSGIAVILDHQVVASYPEEEGDEVQVIGHRHFRLDPNVPFGRIYEFPSMDAYEIWQERGCPPAV